ncbi:uncharacterized protein LOC126708238 [Quercus robur]|uniref:uncharacterized protein LOC126708238 n=1 Tax=Quercus robur TaxID=38942 RepID=UPI002162D847|nr:uncharacterized protein LOC126708238 [Quercus robur]
MQSTLQGGCYWFGTRVFEKVDCAVGRFSVNVLFKGVVDDFVWACSGVYGPNEDSQRGALWEELSRMHSRWNTTWCVFGDFNTIRYPSERFGCEAFSPAMFAFSDFIEANYLVDLPLEGASFTWFRDSGSDCMSRIDRTLASVDWVDHFGNVSQRVLPRVVSDHCPLLVVAGSVNKGRSAFKFENMWLKEEGFVERVRQWWNGYYFSGSPSFILGCKLKALKEDLKKWNKEEFGDLAFRKKCLLSDLLGLDAREDLSGLSHEDQTRRTQIKGEIAHLASLEEISWRQKSRFLFVKEGDNNTRFFHRVANSYRRTNYLRGIEVDGVLYEDEEEVRSKVVHFYQSLYTESDTWRPSMDGLEFSSIEEDEQLELERDFSKERW